MVCSERGDVMSCYWVQRGGWAGWWGRYGQDLSHLSPAAPGHQSYTILTSMHINSEKVPTSAFSLLKTPNSAFTLGKSIKTL